MQPVTPGGPAAKAGVQASDIIVGINGQKIEGRRRTRPDDLRRQPGNSVDLKLLRDGKPMEVSVKIGDRAAIVADNGAARIARGVSGGETTAMRAWA